MITGNYINIRWLKYDTYEVLHSTSHVIFYTKEKVIAPKYMAQSLSQRLGKVIPIDPYLTTTFLTSEISSVTTFTRYTPAGS